MPRSQASTPAPHGPARWLDTLTGLAAFALVLVVPLVWSAQSTSPFRAPKSALALVCWVVLAAVLLARNLPDRGWLDVWWLPWAAVVAGAVASAPFSGKPAEVLVGAAALLAPALGWGALRQTDQRFRERLVTWVVVAGSLEAALTLAFLSPALQPAGFGGSDGRELWIGTLGNPGDVAVFLVVPALLAADRAFDVSRRRLAYGAAALVMAAVIASSQSVSGTAAMALGGLLLAWRRLPRRRLVPVLAAAAVGLAILVVATPLRERVTRLSSQFQRTRLTWVGSGRLAGYQAAVGMLADNPVVGVGFDRYGAESFSFQNEWTLAFRARELGLVTGFGQAHNDLLQHAAETGLLGIALLVAGVWVALRRGSGEPGVALPRLPLVAAAGVLVLLQFPFHLAAVAGQWLVVWAVAVPPLPRPAGPRAAGVRAAVAVVVAIVAAVAGWRFYRATVALQQAKILVTALRSAPGDRRRPEIARRALEELDTRRPYLPFSWDLELTLGNLAMEAGDATAALDRFRTALRLGERPETHFNIGMALLSIGDRATGLAELERAVRLNPAMFAQIANPEVSRSLRKRLDASGYGTQQPWIYRGTPAARP